MTNKNNNQKVDNNTITRRNFISSTLAATIITPALLSLPSGCAANGNKNKNQKSAVMPYDAATDTAAVAPLFNISLAEWSLHRMLYSSSLSNLEFPAYARTKFGIYAVEYVSTFFKDRADDIAYLGQLRSRASDQGVKSLLIMIDGEGHIGNPDEAQRIQAVENHYRWVRAAKFLGCHSIRVNAQSAGTPEEQLDLAADGLRRLTEYAVDYDINVIVENHGGLSSNGAWLASVIEKVAHERCGTLPDFGNFNLGDDKWYDRYMGVEQLMPFAKAVSAKSHDFDEAGYETNTDYLRMMNIVLFAGYRGYVGIEYEGNTLSEIDGVLATKKLLERLRDELTPLYT